MSESDRRKEPGFDRGYAGHWRRQVRLGLELSPAERLRWLEQAVEELSAIVGRAREAERRKQCDRATFSD